MEVVRLLVDRKVDLNAPASNGWTPVHIAARKGHHAMVQLLTNHGADLNTAALDGATPLYAAVLNNHFDVAKLLLKNGADPNLAIETGELPVMIAARGGCVITHLRTFSCCAPLPLIHKRHEKGKKED